MASFFNSRSDQTNCMQSVLAWAGSGAVSLHRLSADTIAILMGCN